MFLRAIKDIGMTIMGDEHLNPNIKKAKRHFYIYLSLGESYGVPILVGGCKYLVETTMKHVCWPRYQCYILKKLFTRTAMYLNVLEDVAGKGSRDGEGEVFETCPLLIQCRALYIQLIDKH